MTKHTELKIADPIGIPAIDSADATAEWIAFMVRHTSGYLCAPLTAERADELGLPLMVLENEDERQTAYTITVDAAELTSR